MCVLILSTPQDVHAQAVAAQLLELGVEHHYLSFEELITNTKLRFELDADGVAGELRQGSGGLVDLGSVSAVWFRRPGTVRFSGLPEPWMDAMAGNEAQQAAHGILRALPDCLFVNHPGREYECSFKLWQLEVARRVGLTVPRTLVTNQPENAAEFYERCGGAVVYKLISESSNFLGPKYDWVGVPTLPLTEDDLPHLGQVAAAPHFFQERIDKRYDIRVTAIGRKLFAVKIDSQAGQGVTDWRTDYSVAIEKTELRDEVERACVRLISALGLNYGAIDLCLDRDGRHVFFEVNSAGQYLWMEQRIEGLPLSLELARLLGGESEPLAPAATIGSDSMRLAHTQGRYQPHR